MQGVVGTVREVLASGHHLVDWDEHEAASREGWCRMCLIPIDDPKAMSLRDLAKNIGWKLPVKEPA